MVDEAISANDSAFIEKYGPWAVVAGASEGIGAEYVRQLAKKGVNCVLVSRRREILDELAKEVESDSGIETRVIVADLSIPSASARIYEAVRDLDVGLYISNAGADSNPIYFLDNTFEYLSNLLQRNTDSVVEACYLFGGALVKRGRGGIIIMSSGAGMRGAPGIALYAATKSFEMTFAEGLWAEFKQSGVDVIGIVTPGTDTPALRRLLTSRNLHPEGLYSSGDVAETALAALGDGPLYIFPSMHSLTPEQAAELRAERKAGVEAAGKASAIFIGDQLTEN